ncbi:hypothetical protein KFK09_005657 [Dendrobium nobile]|uniref:Uncharacterized protein n=1 Tax=Dendrobium nobile TaxID=94219 RepID=A0A8T3C155_DENNO|nr:hypothetical protein KFK09_005657 [Dendrobium nobile]
MVEEVLQMIFLQVMQLLPQAFYFNLPELDYSLNKGLVNGKPDSGWSMCFAIAIHWQWFMLFILSLKSIKFDSLSNIYDYLLKSTHFTIILVERKAVFYIID